MDCREDLYRQAREAGVMFIRYDFDKPLSVTPDNKGVKVSFTDSVFHLRIDISALKCWCWQQL